MHHARSRSAFLLVAAIAATPLHAAPSANAAERGATQLNFSLRLANSGVALLGRVINNCQLLEGAGWSLPQTTTKYTFAEASGPPIGALDFKARTGSAYIKSGGLQVERILTPHPFALRFADLGVQFDGPRMYLVGRMTKGVPQTAAAKRVRLAVVRRAKYETGPLLDAKNRAVPSTFTSFASGRLTMLRAMTKAFDRTRCKGPRYSSRPFPVGFEVGRLEAVFRPDVAVSLEGTSKSTFDIRTLDTDAPITLEPTGGATRDNDGALVAPLPGGVPLACLRGAYCVPGSGSVPLASFDMVWGDRRVSVTNVAITSSRTGPNEVREVVTGTLDGAPVTIFDAPRFLDALPPRNGVTDDFAQRASTALGTSVSGDLRLEFLATRTGPA